MQDSVGQYPSFQTSQSVLSEKQKEEKPFYSRRWKKPPNSFFFSRSNSNRLGGGGCFQLESAQFVQVNLFSSAFISLLSCFFSYKLSSVIFLYVLLSLCFKCVHFIIFTLDLFVKLIILWILAQVWLFPFIFGWTNGIV